MQSKQESHSGNRNMGNYQVRVKGHLNNDWTEWFGSVSITLENNGETTITCQGMDQAELFRILKKIRNLGLPLLSVKLVDSEQENKSDFQDEEQESS